MDLLLGSVLTLIVTIVTLYKWIIIIHALLSWVNPDPYNPLVQIINKLVSPAYQFVKKYIKKTTFNQIDITAILIILVLMFIETFLNGLLHKLAF